MAGGRITLSGVRAWAHHGVLEAEREQGQIFRADVAVELDLAAAATSDQLEDTVDYGALVGVVQDRLVAPRRDLVEAVAGHVARGVLDHDRRITAVEVTVHKPDAPVPAVLDDVAVTVRLGRDRR